MRRLCDGYVGHLVSAMGQTFHKINFGLKIQCHKGFAAGTYLGLVLAAGSVAGSVFVPLVAGYDVALAQSNDVSVEAPEVLDLDDPFARGINRASELATGGIALPEPIGELEAEAKTGRELQGLKNQQAVAGGLYRVAGVVVTEGASRGQIFISENRDIKKGSKPKLAYLRIGQFDKLEDAQQRAIDLRANMEPYLGAHFIIRQPQSGAVLLDIGPTPSVDHAERYCEILKSQSNGLVLDCYPELEYPEYEPLDTFQSTALVKVAADAVKNIISDSELFDLQSSADQLLMMAEGDMLGAGTDMVTKVTPDGVLLVAEDGTITSLFLNYIPEQQYQGAQAEAPPPPAPAEELPPPGPAEN